ncbi:MAG TPA: DUF4913 domain-containing protein [Acidimicrobiales bacterium]|nr:DUF4913 domain-containing protein [Acidimicrobiales bacterium]
MTEHSPDRQPTDSGDQWVGQLTMPLDTEPGPAPEVETVDGEDDEEPGPYFGSLEGFVAGYLAQTLCRKPIRRAWCPRWWAHPEAVLRLMALWQAWEAFRVEGGTGLSSWWVYHADHHLAFLFDPETGPFAGCRDEHQDLAGLDCEPMPDDLAVALAEASNGGPPADTPEAYASGEEDGTWDSTAVATTSSAGHG